MLNVVKNGAPHMLTCTPPEKLQCNTTVCIPNESREVFTASIRGKSALKHSNSIHFPCWCTSDSDRPFIRSATFSFYQS